MASLREFEAEKRMVKFQRAVNTQNKAKAAPPKMNEFI